MLSTSHFCCVLKVFVLLEGESSAQPEVLNALDWVFIKALNILVHWLWRVLSVPNAEKQPHSMRLIPEHNFWDVTLQVMSNSWLSWKLMLGIEVHQTRESCFSQSEDPFGAFLQITSMFSCVFTEESIEFCHTVTKPRSVECCSDVCPSVSFSYLHTWSWSSTRVTIKVLVTTLTKALLH